MTKKYQYPECQKHAKGYLSNKKANKIVGLVGLPAFGLNGLHRFYVGDIAWCSGGDGFCCKAINNTSIGYVDTSEQGKQHFVPNEAGVRLAERWYQVRNYETMGDIALHYNKWELRYQLKNNSEHSVIFDALLSIDDIHKILAQDSKKITIDLNDRVLMLDKDDISKLTVELMNPINEEIGGNK